MIWHPDRLGALCSAGCRNPWQEFARGCFPNRRRAVPGTTVP